MNTKIPIPSFLSMAAALLMLLPYAPINKTRSTDMITKYVGTNTFYCELNDQVLTNSGKLKVTIIKNNDTFLLSLLPDNLHPNQINFILKGEKIYEKAYEMDSPEFRYITFDLEGKECSYLSEEPTTGMLMIHKYDTINKIIAGSFEFMMYSSYCKQMVFVKDGSFDATYQE